MQSSLLFGSPGSSVLLNVMSLPVIPAIRREKMIKKQLGLLFAMALTFPLAVAVFAQDPPAKAKESKEARWEGRVERSSKEQSSLTVRKAGGSAEKTCV